MDPFGLRQHHERRENEAMFRAFHEHHEGGDEGGDDGSASGIRTLVVQLDRPPIVPDFGLSIDTHGGSFVIRKIAEGSAAAAAALECGDAIVAVDGTPPRHDSDFDLL